MSIKSLLGNIAIATAICTASIANAGTLTDTQAATTQQLSPLQAHTIAMQNFTAVVYYVIADDGTYNIVTTIGPNQDVNGIATQHHATLEVGQSYLLGLDQGTGSDPLEAIRFTATAEELVVARR